MNFTSINSRLEHLYQVHIAAQTEWYTERKAAVQAVRDLFDAAWEARFPGVSCQASVMCHNGGTFVHIRTVEFLEVLEDKQWGTFVFDTGGGTPLRAGETGPFPVEELFQFVEQFASEHVGLQVGVQLLGY